MRRPVHKFANTLKGVYPVIKSNETSSGFCEGVFS